MKRVAAAITAVLLAAGCACQGNDARRAYMTSLKLSKTGRPLEEQLTYADRAVRLEPDSASYLERRADLLFALGRPSEARADYDRAVTLADRPYLRFARADVSCALGDFDAALADLDRAIARQPENTQFYPRRALARMAAGKLEAAREDVDHAMAQTRGGAEERYARGALLLLEGKPAQAVPDLDAAVSAWADSSHGALPRTMRLLAFLAQEQPERAAAELDAQVEYQHWLTARSCDNALIPAQLGHLTSRLGS